MYKDLTVTEGLSWLTAGVPSRAYINSSYFGVEAMSQEFSVNWDKRYKLRPEWTTKLSFAIPCQEALQFIQETSKGRQGVLECGAGTGYWTALLANKGVNILATNITNGKPITSYNQSMGRFTSVIPLEASQAVQQNPDRDLLLVWPCYKRNWAAKAIEKLKRGNYLYLVSEGRGGCVGNDRLFNLLDTEFVASTKIYLPHWEGIHDYLSVYERL